MDSNHRRPKPRDLQSDEIQSLPIYHNSYQYKIQYLAFKYLSLKIEKNCLFLVITVPPVSHFVQFFLHPLRWGYNDEHYEHGINIPYTQYFDFYALGNIFLLFHLSKEIFHQDLTILKFFKDLAGS